MRSSVLIPDVNAPACQFHTSLSDENLFKHLGPQWPHFSNNIFRVKCLYTHNRNKGRAEQLVIFFPKTWAKYCQGFFFYTNTIIPTSKTEGEYLKLFNTVITNNGHKSQSCDFISTIGFK